MGKCALKWQFKIKNNLFNSSFKKINKIHGTTSTRLDSGNSINLVTAKKNYKKGQFNRPIENTM